MKRKFDRVYQFKITLKGIKPPIWRKIQIPETYTFWDLHVAIQDAMGWEDYHLHEFKIVDPSTGKKVAIGILDEEDFGPWSREILPSWKEKITDYFSMENRIAEYIYDFGDHWEHKVVLEKILPREKNVKYPRCIGGKRACPPEDCGGVWGYKNFLEALRDPKHPQHKELLDWIGEEFGSEHFDCSEVHFDDPARRRRIAFE